MKSISTNGFTALDEVERRLLLLVDEIDPKYTKQLEELQQYLETIRTQLHNFKAKALEKAEAKINEDFIRLCMEHKLDPEQKNLKEMFMKSHQEKIIYIKELEGLLSGDPNLMADEYSINHWRHCAVEYANKLEQKIKDLEIQIKGK